MQVAVEHKMSLGMVNIANSFYDQDSIVQATFVSQIAKSTRAELWYSYAWHAATYTEQIRQKGLIYTNCLKSLISIWQMQLKLPLILDDL